MTRNFTRPCDFCGERMLPEALADVSEFCGRERVACEECEVEVMADVRAEELAEFYGRQVW
jgi:hypothetical protein